MVEGSPLSAFPGMEGVEYCPVAIGARVLGDRWSLLIVRELIVGATRFNEIHRALPGLSRSLLSSRLRTLVRDGLLVKGDADGEAGYRLTEAGVALRPVLIALGEWTVQWRFPMPEDSEKNSALMLWRMYQGLDPAALPATRTTLEIVFTDADPGRGWLVLEGGESSLCAQPPGHGTDLTVRGTVPVWLQVWFGHVAFADAVATGQLSVTGPRELATALPSWFRLSHFADLVAKGRAAVEH
ncbi:MAG: winged helix-turn-helix transcriptional regulator [Sporichthyaceae bacterium]